MHIFFRGKNESGCSTSTRGANKETIYSDRIFRVSYILFIITIGGILLLFIYTTRLASNRIFSSSNKIHREVCRAKYLSAPLHICFHGGSRNSIVPIYIILLVMLVPLPCNEAVLLVSAVMWPPRVPCSY